MPETSIPTPPGFAQLSKTDQVKYLQSLWNQISERPDEIPVPESHLQLVEERLGRYRQDTTPTQSAFEVIDRLQKNK